MNDLYWSTCTSEYFFHPWSLWVWLSRFVEVRCPCVSSFNPDESVSASVRLTGDMQTDRRHADRQVTTAEVSGSNFRSDKPIGCIIGYLT